MPKKRTAGDNAVIGLGMLGGMAASGLFYYLFGPRCQYKRCNALLPPGANRCPVCERIVKR